MKKKDPLIEKLVENYDHLDKKSNKDKGANQEEIGSKQKGLLLQILSSFKGGLDASSLLVPVDFCETRSLLEKITDFYSHGYLIMNACDYDEPMLRMMGLVKWYLTAWHVKPKGVKKPFNPVLGEVYRCCYEMHDGSRTVYMAEQVKHHPPISAMMVENRSRQLRMGGWYYPRTKVSLSGSIGSVAEGIAHIYMDKHKEHYVATWPDFWARGLLFGPLTMEICGQTHIECKESGLRAEFDFKSKPFFGGDYNVLECHVYKNKKLVYTIKGKWDESFKIKAHGSKEWHLLFDCKQSKSMRLHKTSIPDKDLLSHSSHHTWSKLTKAIDAKDIKKAGEAKHSVEEAQRKLAKERKEKGVEFVPKYFKKGKDNFWHFIGQDTPEYQALFHKYGSEEYEKLSAQIKRGE